MIAELPYITLECELAFEGLGRMSGFFENVLRGTFGASLREITCVTRAPACKVCVLAASCVYARTIEPRSPEGAMLASVGSAPAPYMFFCDTEIWDTDFWAAKPGLTLPIYLRLFGREAIDNLPYYIAALLRMQQKGLGKDRVAFTVNAITSVPSGEILYTAGARDTQKPSVLSRIAVDPDALLEDGPPCDLDLVCLSPLRLQKDGHIVRRPTAQLFFHALMRRLALLFECYAEKLPWDYRAIQARLSGVRMEPVELQLTAARRYSGRQKRVIKLQAPLGRFRFFGLPPAGRKLLETGVLISVGKSTTFGFGRFWLEPCATWD